MTTTYLDILIEKVFACGELDEDLRLRARAELREMQRRRDVLIVSSKYEQAWAAPYSEGLIRSLISYAEAGDHEAFRRTAEGHPSLAPQHHFEARHYSEVVVL